MRIPAEPAGAASGMGPSARTPSAALMPDNTTHIQTNSRRPNGLGLSRYFVHMYARRSGGPVKVGARLHQFPYLFAYPRCLSSFRKCQTAPSCSLWDCWALTKQPHTTAHLPTRHRTPRRQIGQGLAPQILHAANRPPPACVPSPTSITLHHSSRQSSRRAPGLDRGGERRGVWQSTTYSTAPSSDPTIR